MTAGWPPPTDEALNAYLGLPIIESPWLTWRDPPLAVTEPGTGPVLYVGDVRYFRHQIEGSAAVRKMFDELYAQFGLTRARP